MQSGYHFFLDDISKEEKQEVIFSYTKVWLKDEHQLKEQGITSTEAIPTYPIYVTINQDAATFHFIGLVASEGGNIKWIAQHFEILSLPLFPNLELKDDLSETLVKIIDEAVEVERDLYECEREREAFSVSKAKKGLLDALESNSNQPKNGQGFFAQPLFTYSSLEEVVLFSTSEDRPSVEKSRLFDTTSLGQLSESDENGKKAFIPKRELLLDFLFDFTHSSVFDNSIHKVNVEVKLKECPLTDAVINKCEYYFARENYFLSAQIDNYNSLTGSRRDNSIRKSWSEKLESAEKDYVNTIISDGATEVFMNSGGWLFPVEQELKAVIFNDNPHTKHIINTIFKKIKNRANYPAISLPKKVTNLGFRFIFRVVSLMRKFKFILPLFVLVMAFFPFKWIFQPNVLHFFLAAIFIFLIVAYFIRKIAEAFKGSINEKDRKRRTYNRAIWQRWIKKEIEREFKGKESPVIRKSLEENRLQNQLFQRATNNFFLRRYNIHQAYRNSIP
ncbi:MAG: hypothetical protein H6558_15355 [Lewinellaceae bacterium]|nr:hypothetical protein [Lewinellaceae bacterium]